MMDPNENRFIPLSETEIKKFRDAYVAGGFGDEAPIFRVGEEIPLRGYVWSVQSMQGNNLMLVGVRPTKRAARKRHA